MRSLVLFRILQSFDSIRRYIAVFSIARYMTCSEPKEPIITLHPSSLRSILILLSYLGLRLESGSFPRRSQTNVTRSFLLDYAFYISTISF